MAKSARLVNNKLIILSAAGVAALISLLAFNFNKPKDIIAGVPSEVNKFVQAKDISLLKDQNFTVYTGSTSPNIEGAYILDSLRSTYNSDGEETGGFVNYRMQIFDQKKDTVSTKYSSLESSDTDSGGGAFISGEGNCFTIFVEEKGKSDNGCNYRVSSIISGCLSEQGIQNYQNADIMKYKDDKPICGEVEGGLMPVGNVRIIVEEDKLAERE